MKKNLFIAILLAFIPTAFGQSFFNPICSSTGSTDCEIFPDCQIENEPYLACWSFLHGRHVCCYSPPFPGDLTTPPEPDMDDECAYLACIEVGDPAPCTWLTHQDGTPCDDGNFCTGVSDDDICMAGKCVGTPAQFDPETHCCHPDFGVFPLGDCVDEDCIPKPDGLACGDQTSTYCDNSDTCLNGVCRKNFIERMCDDNDFCSYGDKCIDGLCIGAYPTATLNRNGARRFRVDVRETASQPSDFPPVSIQIVSPEFPCFIKYINLDGALQDEPLFATIPQWNTSDFITAYGVGIIPDTLYQLYVNCQGSEVFTPSNCKISYSWGDVVGTFYNGAWTPPQGIVDFNDVAAAVEVFRSEPTAPPLEWVDCSPELVDWDVNFIDISCIVDAFNGVPCPYSIPCE